MPETSVTYRAMVRAATAAVPLFAPFSPKLGAGHRARRDGAARLHEWARLHRDPTRPLVWFHASSVGEGLQAESVIDALRRIRPACQFVYTHFSPSAEPLARRLSVDTSGYVPYDLPGDVGPLLEALLPDLLVFSKLEPLARARDACGQSWRHRRDRRRHRVCRKRAPAMARETTARRGICQRRSRGRDRGGRCPLGSSGSAVPLRRSASSAIRGSIVPPLECVRPGLTIRFSTSAEARPPSLRAPPGPETRQCSSMRSRRSAPLEPDARLIIVPHEPTAEHLAGVEARARRAKLPPPVRLSAATGPVPFLVVDRLGALAALYGGGLMAYVGGGFGRAGLHSVLEPAAWGLPVAFGPRWQDSRDAELLVDVGAGVSVSDQVEMARLWEEWLRDETARAALGERARMLVNAGLGAAQRSAEMLDGLISSRRPRTSPSAGR